EETARTRAELPHPWALAPDRCRVAGRGMATSGAVAGSVAPGLSCRAPTASRTAAQAAQTARTATGEAAQTQGGPSHGQAQREERRLRKPTRVSSRGCPSPFGSIDAGNRVL